MDKDKPILTIIRGYPGQGKSTFAKKNFSCLILENDMFHMHNGKYEFDIDNQKKAINWCIETTSNALKYGMDVCVANTFTKKKYVDAYKRLADVLGCDFKVYRMMGEFKNVHNVPKFVMESMKNGFEDYEGEILVQPS